MDNIFISSLIQAYGPYLSGALWLSVMLLLIGLAAFCVLLARRGQGWFAPPVLVVLGVVLLAVAGVVWKESRMVLWQGALGLSFLLALVLGQTPRARRRPRRRYRY